MHGTIQTIHAARGFGFLRDPEGTKVFGSRDAGGVRAGVGSHRAPHREAHRHACEDASAPIVCRAGRRLPRTCRWLTL